MRSAVTTTSGSSTTGMGSLAFSTNVSSRVPANGPSRARSAAARPTATTATAITARAGLRGPREMQPAGSAGLRHPEGTRVARNELDGAHDGVHVDRAVDMREKAAFGEAG